MSSWNHVIFLSSSLFESDELSIAQNIIIEFFKIKRTNEQQISERAFTNDVRFLGTCIWFY